MTTEQDWHQLEIFVRMLTKENSVDQSGKFSWTSGFGVNPDIPPSGKSVESSLIPTRREWKFTPQAR
ncbi:MAG: hypothetical protein ACU841_00750 [Gammaproteobacteria bacterium]